MKKKNFAINLLISAVLVSCLSNIQASADETTIPESKLRDIIFAQEPAEYIMQSNEVMPQATEYDASLLRADLTIFGNGNTLYGPGATGGELFQGFNVSTNVTLTIHDIVMENFYNDMAGYSGGAIEIFGDNANLYMYGTNTFRNNTANANGSTTNGHGGAIAFRRSINTTGEAIIDSGATGTTSFIENKAYMAAGAISVGDADLTITGNETIFDGNKTLNEGTSPDVHGGAIHLYASNSKYSSKLTITSKTNTFINNSASSSTRSRAGAIYIHGYQTNFLLGGETNLFENNTAGEGGGAIHNGAVVTIDANSTTFKENKLTGTGYEGGGAIYNWGKFTIEGGNNLFEGNIATGTGATVNGGAIANIAYSETSGTPTQMIIKGVNIYKNNEAKSYGGAIYNGVSQEYPAIGSLTLEGTHTFSANKAANGGAIAGWDATPKSMQTATKVGSTTLTATNGKYTFIANTATNNGGAIFNSGNSAIDIANADFINNTAGQNGGAIYNEKGSGYGLFGGLKNALTITDSSFFNNNATSGNGGAIYIGHSSDSGKVTINAKSKDVIFTGNKANGESNAIYTANGTKLYINADEGTSVIFNDAINGQGTGQLFLNNEATNTGTITFNEMVANNNITINAGTLKFGSVYDEAGAIISSGQMDSAKTLTVNNATIDTIDNAIRKITPSSTAITNGSLSIDVDLSKQISDTFSGTITATGDINFKNINIIGDIKSGTGTLTVFDNADKKLFGDFAAFGNDYKVDFKDNNSGKLTYTASAINDGFMTAAGYTDSDRSYTFKDNENLSGNIGEMGGENSSFHIQGNDNTLNGASHKGITVKKDQTFSIDGLTATNFENKEDNGSFISNNGQVHLHNATITNNHSNGQGGAIYNQSEGIINITGNTTFSGNKSAKGSNAIHNEGTINIGSGNIVFNDAITGGNANPMTRAAGENGKINVENSNVTFNDLISGNDITVKGNTTMQLNSSFDSSVNYTHEAGSVSLRNNNIASTNLGNLTLNGDMNLLLDANLRTEKLDQITADSFTNQSDYHINISDIVILEPTTKTSFSMSPIGEMEGDENGEIRSKLAQAIEYTGGETIYSPIFKYKTTYDKENALLNFNLQGNPNSPSYNDVNPQVMSSSVAAQMGGYLSQLYSYDEGLRSLDTYMFMPKAQRQALRDSNKYAYADDTQWFYTPVDTPTSTKAGWLRPYTTFENVKMKHGPKVSNLAYGTYAGLESPLIHKDSGWDKLGSVYVGYNGSHQRYDGINMYQNGATIGLTGIAMKKNFFSGATLNTGSNIGTANSDDFLMLMGGVAAKTGYNFEIADGKFIMQPSYLISYSFVHTFDYTSASGVRMNSDLLNAVQMEPGIRFIFNLDNGWQPYAGVSVVWNIIDKSKFYANDVSLPELSIKPFAKYGVGIRKDYDERITGYAQAFALGGGRNGVGLQAGFKIKI